MHSLLGGSSKTGIHLSIGRPQAIFMHCLPARRGQELEAEVIDGSRSIVFAQARNLLYPEKAILLSLIR